MSCRRRPSAHHEVVVAVGHVASESRSAADLPAVLQLDARHPGGQRTSGVHEQRGRLTVAGRSEGRLDGACVGSTDSAASPHRIHVLSLDAPRPHDAARHPAGHPGSRESTNSMQR